MNGIDVSSYQADLDVSTVTADFVIVKATQVTLISSKLLLRAKK
jgi:GH25 family lysozyme M1 (1,4-beta-N-acetylmuramidase)